MLQRGFAVVRTQSLRSQERQFITCRCLSQKKKKARPMRVAEKLVLPEYRNLDELLQIRRQQAQHSVLIQHSSDNVAHVFEKCIQYGPIKVLLSYHRNEKNLLLVEFEEAESVQRLLGGARHFKNDQHMPIETPFLFLPRIDNGRYSRREERLPPEKEHLLYRELPRNPDRLVTDLVKAANMSAQIMTLHATLMMSDLHTRERFMMCHLVEGVLNRIFGHCLVHPFGSSFSGLGKYDCDLDMFCDMRRLNSSQPHGPGNGLLFLSKLRSEDSRQDQQNNLAMTADIMQYVMPQTFQVRRILRASVPIIRFTHATGLQCDISMENRSAHFMTELLHLYGQLDFRVRPLVFAVRYWAKETELTAQSGGPYLSNFMLTLMAIYYLQQGDCPLLPSVDQLRQYAGQADVKMVDGEDCTFVSDWTKVPRSKNNKTLEELFVGFLQFYEKFDFLSQGLSIVSGTPVEKPEGSEVYIINPIERELNVCKNVSEAEIVRFNETCRNSLQLLESPTGGSSWGLLAFRRASETSESPKISMNISNIFDTSKEQQKSTS